MRTFALSRMAERCADGTRRDRVLFQNRTQQEITLAYAIEAVDLTKRFPRAPNYLDLLPGRPQRLEFPALRNVSLCVNTGELFGLLGPNGAGKTTFMKILSTLILPTTGTALVHGYDVRKHGAEIRRIVGYVIGEERSFYWRLTGRQNLRFFAAMNNLSSPDSARRVTETLELVGLQDKADAPFRNYSKGMRSRLSIARALLSVPDVLLLDEPTRSLDPPTARAMQQFIKGTLVGEHGKTVFLATHNLHEAEDLCDRVAIIDRGGIKVCGSPEEMGGQWGTERGYSLQVVGMTEDLLEETRTWQGVIDATILSSSPSRCTLRITLDGAVFGIADVVERFVRSNVRIEACHPEHHPLYDAFAHFTEGRIAKRC